MLIPRRQRRHGLFSLNQLVLLHAAIMLRFSFLAVVDALHMLTLSCYSRMAAVLPQEVVVRLGLLVLLIRHGLLLGMTNSNRLLKRMWPPLPRPVQRHIQDVVGFALLQQSVQCDWHTIDLHDSVPMADLVIRIQSVPHPHQPVCAYAVDDYCVPIRT